ncbi:MAG: hypothetical protein ACK4U0_00440 [Mesorhizobium sp.]
MTLQLSELARARRDLFVSVLRSALGVEAFLHQPKPEAVGELTRLWQAFDTESVEALTKAEAEICFSALHAALYSLGPFELHTLTGHTLREYASAGLILANEIYDGGVYLGVLWPEESYP